jgi:hypothetical protein
VWLPEIGAASGAHATVNCRNAGLLTCPDNCRLAPGASGARNDPAGDMAHFRENYASDGVPSINYDRSQTVASIERVKQIASNLKAEIVIQHDARDVQKLPIFPASAK